MYNVMVKTNFKGKKAIACVLEVKSIKIQRKNGQSIRDSHSLQKKWELGRSLFLQFLSIVGIKVSSPSLPPT